MKILNVCIALLVAGCENSIASGCGDIDVSSGTIESSEASAFVFGPDHDDVVHLADNKLWEVPPLPANQTGRIVWTLAHPNGFAEVFVRRTCTSSPEPFLWLSDPPDFGGGQALATFHECGKPGEFYATIQLVFDGQEWVGISATGAATLNPPN